MGPEILDELSPPVANSTTIPNENEEQEQKEKSRYKIANPYAVLIQEINI